MAHVRAMPVPGESAITPFERWTVLGAYSDDEQA